MKSNDCFFEQVSRIGIGISLLFIAMGLCVIGVTLFPLLGLLVAAPVLFMAIYFFAAPQSPECALG